MANVLSEFFNILNIFYEGNIKDKKLEFLNSLLLPVVNIIQFALEIFAALVLWFESSWTLLRDFAHSINGPIDPNNWAVGHLTIGFVWPITIAMEFISDTSNLSAIREKDEVKSCLMLLLIMKNGDIVRAEDARNFRNCINRCFEFEDFTAKIDEDYNYSAYKARVEDRIKLALKTYPNMTSDLIGRVKNERYEHKIPDACAFKAQIIQDWNNHLHDLKRQKIAVILSGTACFFALLFAINECFEYVVKVGAASAGLVNFTLWLAPNIVWLAFPFLVTFSFVKLGVVLYDHISLIYGKGSKGTDFLANVGGRYGKGWENLAWWEKAYKPFTYNSCNLLLSYLVIVCRAGLIFSMLATGTLISAPAATIIGSSLFLILTVAWLTPYIVGVVSRLYTRWCMMRKNNGDDMMLLQAQGMAVELTSMANAEAAPIVEAIGGGEVFGVPDGTWLDTVRNH